MTCMSPGGHSSGGRALTAKVRGPRFNPGWLLVFHSSLRIFPSLSSCTSHIHVYRPEVPSVEVLVHGTHVQCTCTCTLYIYMYTCAHDCSAVGPSSAAVLNKPFSVPSLGGALRKTEARTA